MSGMTVKQASEYLEVGERQILYYIAAGRLSAERIGERVWLLDADSVKSLVRRPAGRPRNSA
jgi:excisionase family DNA binding protein